MTTAPAHKRLWTISFLLVSLIRLSGTAFGPALLAYAPIWLVVTSPFLAHLVLAAPLLPAWQYFPVAITVSIAHCLLGYFFGRAHGAGAQTWIARHTPVRGRRLELLLSWLERFAPAVLFAFPGPIPATLAGGIALPRLKFYLVMATAQISWVTACYFVGGALLEAITQLRAFVAEHALVLTLLTTAYFGGRHLVLHLRATRSDTQTDE